MAKNSWSSIENINNWGLTNSLFNLKNWERDLDKVYLCAKDPYEAKDQFLFNERENTDLKTF